MTETIRISRELSLFLSFAKKDAETASMTLERLLGVTNLTRKVGVVAMTRVASAADGATMVQAGNYAVIDRLEIGDEVVLPWRSDSKNQRALNVGVWRASKRTGHRHQVIPEYAGLRVIRLA